MHAPVAAVVRCRHGRVVLQVQELGLRHQAAAHFVTQLFCSIRHGYAPPSTARSRARFTATRASWTLYPFRLSGFLFRPPPPPAAVAVASVMLWVASACSALGTRQGVGATWPSTT